MNGRTKIVRIRMISCDLLFSGLKYRVISVLINYTYQRDYFVSIGIRGNESPGGPFARLSDVL